MCHSPGICRGSQIREAQHVKAGLLPVHNGDAIESVHLLLILQVCTAFHLLTGHALADLRAGNAGKHNRNFGIWAPILAFTIGYAYVSTGEQGRSWWEHAHPLQIYV